MKYVKYFLCWYPAIDENLAANIFQMLEFKELTPNQKRIDNFYNHQHIIERFLSPYTPYNELLIFHTMGTGKTCSAFLVLHTFFVHNPDFKALIFVPSQAHKANFIIELTKCVSKGDYPEDYMSRLYRSLSFTTFGTTPYGGFPDKIDVIIVDEVQEIPLEKTEEEKARQRQEVIKGRDTYTRMMENLRKYSDAKKILLSGTPILNSYTEFFQIMNLILPEYLQYGPEFTLGTIDLNDPLVEQEIRKRSYGRISRYISYSETVRRIDHGEDFGGKLKIVRSYASAHQLKTYANTPAGPYNKGLEHPLLFVWPDGSTGVEGLQVHCRRIVAHHERYSINTLVVDLFKRDINHLKECSILYYTVLKEMGIIEPNSEDKSSKESCYFYNRVVNGSGNVLLAAIVEDIFGYEHVSMELLTTKISNIEPKKRYALISSEFGIKNSREITTLAELFSHPLNKEGKLIKLIIGSDKTTLGFNFKNGRQAHAVIGDNSPIVEQAIARIIRGEATNHVGSERYVNVYKHAVALVDRESIHIYNVYKTINKDTNNAKLYSIIDKSAIDCYINKSRFDQLPDFSRECNFLPCNENFKCYSNNISLENIYGNYTSFHRKQKEINVVLNELENFARKGGRSIHVDDIVDRLLPSTSPFLTLDSLHTIITTQLHFKDRLGFRCYIHHHKNILFLYNRPTYDSIEDVIEYCLYPRVFYPEIDSLSIDEAFLMQRDKPKILRLKNEPHAFDELSTPTMSLIFEEASISPECVNLFNYIAMKYQNSIINLNNIENYSDKYRHELESLRGTNCLMIHKISYNIHHLTFNSKIKSGGGIRMYCDNRWMDASKQIQDIATKVTVKEVMTESGTIVKNTIETKSFIVTMESGIIKLKIKPGIEGRRKRECGRDLNTAPIELVNRIVIELLDPELLITDEELKQTSEFNEQKVYKVWNTAFLTGQIVGPFDYRSTIIYDIQTSTSVARRSELRKLFAILCIK